MNENKKNPSLTHRSTSISNFISFPPLFLVLGIVVPGRPARVHGHVRLPLRPGHVIVLGLSLPCKGMPLYDVMKRKMEWISIRLWLSYLDRRSYLAFVFSSWARTGSCPGRSSAGTFEDAFGVLAGLFRNIWPALLGLGCATMGKNIEIS